MTPKVLERDSEGEPTVILYTQTQTELAEDIEEQREQSTRAAEVAKSISRA